MAHGPWISADEKARMVAMVRGGMSYADAARESGRAVSAVWRAVKDVAPSGYKKFAPGVQYFGKYMRPEKKRAKS